MRGRLDCPVKQSLVAATATGESAIEPGQILSTLGLHGQKRQVLGLVSQSIKRLTSLDSSISSCHVKVSLQLKADLCIGMFARLTGICRVRSLRMRRCLLICLRHLFKLINRTMSDDSAGLKLISDHSSILHPSTY